MAKVKALSLDVYANEHYRMCSNGGWTEEHDELYVACPEGPFEVDPDDPALFDLHMGVFGTLRLEPRNKPSGCCGPMMGGSYAGTSDSRFTRMCEHLTGHPWHGAVAVHDRFETWAQYEALSR